MADRFDVAAVEVKEERGVIAGVIPAYAGTAIVTAAGGGRSICDLINAVYELTVGIRAINGGCHVQRRS